MSSLLLIEDDDDIAFALTRVLGKAGYPCARARSGAEAVEQLSQHSFEVALLDVGLPDVDGLDLLPRLLEIDVHCGIVVLTGRDEARLAVRALRAGAADYVVKPFEVDELLHATNRAFQDARLRREVEAIHRSRSADDDVVLCKSPKWQTVARHLEAAAEAPRAPLLILGESGTGKDVAASLVHRLSSRAANPFVAVNAACLPAGTLDSELFGHEAGAFTDARGTKRGLFELAHGGTLFLDEIGELPLELQPKLLRVLEGAPFRRVGGEKEIKTDVRIIAATNRSLEQMVKDGRFREDLYWRLKVIEVQLPPLRERAGDVRQLALHFLRRLAPGGLSTNLLSTAALERLEQYEWPGNIRELKNVVERAVVLARGGSIDVHHLPEEIRGRTVETQRIASPVALGSDETLEAAVRSHVSRIWYATGKNVTRAAKALDISRGALRRKLRECDLYDDAV